MAVRVETGAGSDGGTVWAGPPIAVPRRKRASPLSRLAGQALHVRRAIRVAKPQIRAFARGLLAGLVVLALAALFASAVQAQTVRTLVSNTGQGTAGSTAEVVAQKFTTGANATGYTLSSVSIYPYQNVTNRSGAYVTVKRDSGGRPGALVASLNDPGTNFSGTSPVAFGAPGNTVLAANTDYWVVVNESQSDNKKLTPGRTTSGNQDSDSLSDWSIADGSLKQPRGGDGTWTNESNTVLIDVQGYANSAVAELSIAGGSVLEGGNVTFTVSLEFALPGAATVQYSTSIESSDTASSDDFTAASAQTLSIPAGDTRATFTIATTHDTTAEDDETFTVTLSNPSSNASLGTVKSATGTILDNDGKPEVSIAGATGTEGTSLDFTVSLNHSTAADLTVQYSTSIEAGDTASANDFTAADAATLTIAAGDTSETISIATAPDDRDEDDETFTVTISNPSSNAELGSPTSATGAIEDDDTNAVVLSHPQSPQSRLEVPEGGSTDYTVVLAAEPGNTVTIDLSASAANVLTFSSDRLTFTTSNWDQPQTVTLTGVHDDDAENVNVTVTHDAMGGGYGSLDVDLPVTVKDDDAVEIVVSAPITPLWVPEGGSASFTVALGSLPNQDVTLTIGGLAGTDLTVDDDTLEFTTSDWGTPQTVTVSAAADLDADDDEATMTVTAAGGNYEGIAASLALGVPDTVTGEIELSTELVQVLDFGGLTSYRARLSMQPNAGVTLRITGLGNHTLTFGPTTSSLYASALELNFTRDNWNEWQQVHVSAEVDSDEIHNRFTLRHVASGGGYGPAPTVDLPVLVEDAGVTKAWVLSRNRLSLDEGQSRNYNVKLSRRPSAAVNVTIAGGGNALTLNPASLTFTRDNWFTNQTVGVTAATQVSAEETSLTLTHTGDGGGYQSSALDPKELPVTVVRDAAAIAGGGLSVTSSPLHSNNTYARDETIAVAVRFDRNVQVDTGNGTPHIEVDLGSVTRPFEYVGMGGNRRLDFEYKVQAGDVDADGLSIGNGALALNGATIKDASNQRDAGIRGTLLSTRAGHRVDGGQTLAAAALASLRVLLNGASVTLSPGFSAGETGYTAEIASTASTVTVEAGAAEGGSATVLPADASDSDTGHQVLTDSAETVITINVTRPPRPAGSYTVTLTKTTATVNLGAGASPVAYHLEGQAAEFTVTRDRALDTPLDVNLTMTQTQSFLPGNKLSQRVRIGANQTTGTLSLDDTDLTGGATSNGTLTASIDANSAYSIGADASKTIDLIAADPVIAVRPASASPEFLEDAGTVEIGLVAEGAPGVSIPSSLSFSVSAQSENGTAVGGVDFSHLTATGISFAASDFAAHGGRQTAGKSVSVGLIDDSDQDGDEHFLLRMVAFSLPGGVALTQYDGTACSSICDFRVNILDDESPPAQVTGLVLTPGGGSLAASWSKVTGADGYKVQWKSGSETFADAAGDGRQAAIASGTTTSHTIPSLTDGVSYTVRVIATRGSLDGTASSEVSESPDKPTLSVADASAAEGSPVQFAVTLSRAISSAVTVGYTTSIGSSDTASANDFTAASGETLTIAAGDTGAAFSIATADDTDIEPDETFTVTLSSSSSNAALAGTPSATGTIQNNDAAAAAVSQLAFSNVPSSGHYGVGDTIELSATFSAAVDVTGTPRIPLLMDGTPAADSYALYDAGASSGTVLVFRRAVTAADDDDSDGIAAAANALELNGGTIVNDGTTVAAVLDHAALTGGQVRTRVITNIAVTSAAAVGAPAPVGIYGPGEAVEFTVTFSEQVLVNLAGTPALTFTASDSGEQTASYVRGSGSSAMVFSWTVPNNVPGTETPIGVPSNVGGSAGLQLNGGGITDSNGRAVNLRHPAYTTDAQADTTAPILPGEPGGAVVDGAEVVLTFERGGGLAEHLNETSEPGTGDFIVRDSNSSSTSVTAVDVAGAKVTLTLSSPAGHAQAMTVTYLGSALKDLWGNALGTFTNRALRNDSPEPQLSIADFSVDEDDGNAVFRVNVDVPSGEAAAVDYATSDGTAIGGSDYTATSGRLTIQANRAFADIQVPIADDAIAEQDETFTLTLSNASNATIADSEATATIVDNEATPVLSVTDASAEEGDAVEFSVSLSLAAGQAVTVQYDTSIGATDTASADDFTAASPQTLSIPAGDTSATISIPTAEDTTEEADETFTLTLSNPSSNAEVDSQAAVATGTIENDDVVPARITNIAFTDTPSGGVYRLGDVIEVSVTFNRDVEVTGTPRVKVTQLPADVHYSFIYPLYAASASTDRVLVFQLAATSDVDNSSSGLRIQADGVQLNGGTIRNKGTTVNANRNHALLTSSLNVRTRSISDIEVTSTPAVSDTVTGNPVFGPGETVQFKVTFGQPVTVDTGSGTPQLKFVAGDQGRQTAAYASGSNTAELTFNWTVPADVPGNETRIGIPTNTNVPNSTALRTDQGLVLNGATIQDASQRNINIRHGGFNSNARADTTAPSLLTGADGATVDGALLTLTFKSADGVAEHLDGDSAPAASDFNVTVAGTARTVSGVDVEGAQVELTLASAVGHAQTVTVGYAPGTDALKDLWDQAAAGFTNRSVRNDSPEPVLSIGDVTVAEDGGAAVFTVSLDVASGETVTVGYATADDTAVAGSDYTAATGTLTFDPGDLSETFSVSIGDDSIGEGSEAFTVTLSNASNASIGDGSATGTITDNEQTPTLSIADASAVEGSPVAFTVSLSPAAAGDVTVGYATADGTATTDSNHADGADYTAPAANASLTILAGQGSATISVPTGDDQIYEANESFTLTLSGPSSNAVLGTAKTATGTIENNDTASADATLSSLAAKVEGSAIALTPVFVSGTHAYRADVANTVASVTLEAAATHGRAMVAISDDDDSATPNEAVLGLAFGENTVTVTVTAEDGTTQDYTLVITRALPVVGWDANQFKFIDEDAGDVELEVYLRPASNEAVEVDYATLSDNGSVAGEDYVHTSGSLTFSPGETEKTVVVTILDDTIYEPRFPGNVRVRLSNLSANAALHETNGADILLSMFNDNDQPPTASMEDVSVDEDAGTLTFVLNLSHQVEAEVTYRVSSAGTGGTATAGNDYEQFLEFGNAEIEMSPKQSAANFEVTVLDDAIDEEDETITLDWRRTGTGTAPTATNSINVTGTIVDNDMRGVSVSTDALSLTEGGSDSYEVVLESQPTGTVTVTPTVTGSPDVTLNATVLTFTDSNWDTAQTVTVSADQDTDAVDDEASIAHAVAGADYGANGVTAGSVAVTVDDDETPPVLDLAVSAITGDDTVNIAEKAAGFAISGNTGGEAGVAVSVEIGTDTLTATSSDDGNGTAVWSVDVPADAAYITGASVQVTVSASKTGFTDPADVVRALAIDLTAPTAPTYTPPTSLRVGEAIATMNPSGGSDIDGYSATGLPSGLEIDDSTGAISGTLDTADANTSTATVTVSDTAGNTDQVDIPFPVVAKGVQTLTGFEYSAATMTYGTTAPTVTAPTGAQNTVSYSADPPEVCTVNAGTGELTIVGLGNCIITATAEAGDDYEAGIATFTVAVQSAGNLVLNLDDIADDNTVNIAEKAAGFTIKGDTGTEAGVGVSVQIGSETPLTATSADDSGTATWSVDVPSDAAYITGSSVTVTVSASKIGYTDPADVERTLAIDLTAPTAPTYTPPTSLAVGEAITAMNPTGGADIGGYGATGLPSGLEIDDSTGAITGTPDTADANTSAATVTVTDAAGNTASVNISFPAVEEAVTETVAPSTDATLSRLYLNYSEGGFGLTLNPRFDPTTKSYTASGVYRVNQITVEADVNDDGATPLFLDGADTQLTDADSDAENGFQVDLAVGANTLKVKVTAEDGETTETYTVVVTREAAMASPGALLSNLDQSNTESLPIGDYVNADLHQAMGFQTGSNAGGYTLTSVKALFSAVSNSDDVRVRIFSSSAGGTPDSSLYTLINPTVSIGLNTFTAPANTRLEKSTQYFVVFDLSPARAGDVSKLRGTNSDSLDSMAAGWSLNSGRHGRWGNSGIWTTGSEALLIEINGAAYTPSTDATLSGLSLAGGGTAIALNETFASGTTAYSADVPYTTNSITVTPAKADGKATIEYLDEDDATITDTDANTDALDTGLTVGENVIKIRVTAEDGNSQETYTVTVTVQPALGNLVLNVNAIAGDDTVNIAEKAAGFTIAGDTGSETGVSVTAALGNAELTATSSDDGNGTAAWSVDVPPDAAYITGASLAVTVSAFKTGYAAPADVDRTLTVDLTAPTAPTYTPPTSLKVGEAIATMNPAGGADIDGYTAEGLPSGLEIDDATGAISGTPDTADTDTATTTVTVTDAAGNTDSVDIAFPTVDKGEQTLTGFEYSAATMTFGTTVPTVTAPSGAQTTVSYSADPPEVCTVDAGTGELTIVGLGNCVVTATAEAGDDYEAGIATFTVAVQSAGNLVLNLDDIAGDNTVNIAEKAAGFTITGDTGSEEGVDVSVQIGSETPLTATSADGGNGTATWSVDVPGSAAYITGASVQVTVSASRTGYTDPADVVRALAIDLVAPTAPTYTPPTSLKVGEAITAMNPTGGADIDGYAAEGLPSGLEFDDATGAITGTPDAADANTSTATVTVSDAAGNSTDVEISFPTVDKGEQTLTGFRYSAASMIFGTAVPSVTAPTGAQTTVGYSADPPEVCTVDAGTGELTIIGLGDCVVTATAEASDDYEAGIATFTVTVQPTGNLVLNLDDIAGDNTVNIAEKAAGFAIAGDTGSEEGVDVSVQVGSETPLTATSADNGNGTATWSVDVPANAAYITGSSVTVTVSAARTGFTDPSDVVRALTIDLVAPTAPTYSPPTSLTVGEAIAAMNPSGGADIDGYAAEGLPSGLEIDDSTGAISGTPDSADANTSAATVTVSDAAGNTATVSIAFPAVARGEQTLTGFRYSAASMIFGTAVPTVTAPTGAVSELSYTAAPASVCTVNRSTGALTVVDVGACTITATAGATDDYNLAATTFEVTVVAAGALVLNLDAIAGDNTVNIAEKAAGFAISGNTGSVAGVGVSVRIGSQTPLTATSADGGNGTAAWSVDVPANATYITGTSVPIAVSASRTGFTAPPDIERSLTIDLTPPTAPSYTPPTSLKVGVAMAPMSPSGGANLYRFGAAGLPSGLGIDGATGVIGGTPDTAHAATSTATVTVADIPGNTAAVSITFPSVARGDQTLTGFRYSSASATLGSAAPAPIAPTGAQTSLRYAATPAAVCTVNDVTGALTLVGIGICRVTARAAGNGNYNAATATFTVTVESSGPRSTAVALSANPPSIGEGAGLTSIVVTGALNGAPRPVDTTIAVTVGAEGDTATEGTDYAEIDDLTLTIPAGETSGTATLALAPAADFIDETGEAVSIAGASGIGDLGVTGTTLVIADDDERGVAVSMAALTVPEGLSSTYTVVLQSQPTGAVTVTPSAGAESGVTLDPSTLTFTTDNWNDAQPVTVAATQDEDSEDGSTTVDHAVSGADYASVEAASVAVTVTDSGMPSTAVLLNVDTDTVAEDAGAVAVTATAKLDRAPRDADTRVTVSVGAAADTAVEGRDYAAVADLVLTIPAGEASTQATFTLEPTDDTLIEPDETLSVWGAANAADLDVIGTAIAIRDDDSSNDAPVFPAELERVFEVAENTESEAAIGPPLAATDADGHTLAYALGGPDANHFTIDPANGQLGTLEALDHETKARHPLTVTAEDGHGGQARFSVTVIVTDVDEQPATPEAPAVLAAPGSTDSLELHWSAPDRNGGPAIVGYTVQYREGGSGSWANHRHVGTNTRATIAGLTAATAYQARVRAVNGEIAGEWSEPGAGRTGTADNEAPVFDADLRTLLTVDENTAAGTDLGEPFGATDADGDTLSFMLEGPGRRAFAIDPETGQLRTLAALDRESKASHAVTVRADDGNGGSARLGVTVTVTDLDEQPGTPLAPMVLAARGSTTSLEVNWNAPARNGGPALAGYDLQYRAVDEDDADAQDSNGGNGGNDSNGGNGGNGGQDGQAGNGGQGQQGDAGGQDSENNPGAGADEAAWTDYRHIGASTRAVIPWLDPAASYEVRVRALNGETAGEWSEPGAGRTGVAANMPPVFDSGLPATLTVDENTTAGAGLGAPYSATDADGDTLTWLLDGAAASAFEIDPQSGQLRTLAALDHEDKAVRPLIVRVSDGRGGADELRVRIEVRDVDEQAPTLPAPRVLATADSTTGLDLRWTAPARNGGPAVAGYEVQYRAGTDGEWIDLVHEEDDTRTSEDTRTAIAELEPATDYQARVRALNGEIAGEWSEPGAGRTGTADNTAPAFDAGLPASLTVDENTRPGSELGAPFAATDTDGDTLTWLLDGADSRAFDIDPDSGQLRTRAPLDHEAQSAFALAVRVSDGAGGAATHTVTVDVADLDEQPAQPAPPWVLSSVDAATGLDVRWSAPDASGGPAIAGYEVQYRAGTEGEWIGHVRVDGTETQTTFTDTRTTIADLDPETDYQVRVRALNGETPSGWSAPGAGNTAKSGNAAPEFTDDAATRSVPEDSEAGDPVGAPVAATDADRDRLTYFLEGPDADTFDIDPYTGQIRTRAALDFEAKASHSVTVTANDCNGGAGTIDVAIELVDAQETQAVLGPAAPTGVTLAQALSLDTANVLQAELTLRWDAPQAEDGPAAEIAWIEFRLGRYPESGNGLAAPAFQCAGNRPFQADGWRRILDSGTGGANARAWRFDASALGCRVLPDTFELRAQVRAVSVDEAGTAASAPSTEARMRDEAPRVAGIWLDAAALDELEAGDDLVFSVAFTEPVRVTAADGSPTLGIQLGEETRQAAFASAAEPPLFRNYGSGHIGSRLRFRYELQDGDDPAGGIVVPADAIAAAGGAAIVDATGPGGHAAELRNAGTTIAEGATVVATAEQASLTASFETDSVPEDHDGETAFTVQVRFGESDATGGNGASGGDGSAGDDGSTGDNGSGQAGDDPDDQPISEMAPELPGLSLSEASFLVSGGRLTGLSRLVEGENHLWSLSVEPDSMGEVSISLGPTLDCGAAGAVCTGDGRRLANNIHAVVKGPPTVSVADARVVEAPDATMDFAVTLSRTLGEAVSVDYATADGTATAGEDYTETSGTLTFEPGDTAMTVSVPVLDDAHDDDGETFTLTLSNPSGGNAYLDDDTATGIIENSDPMPKAWIARFGRTVSDHVIGAIQARFRDDRRESQFTLGGLRVDGLFARWNAGASQFADQDRAHGAGAGAAFGAEPRSGGPAFGDGPWSGDAAFGANPWGNAPAFGVPTLAGGGSAGAAGQFAAGGRPGTGQQGAAHLGRGLPNLRQLLMGSSFSWSNSDPDAEQEAGTAGPDTAGPDNRRLWSAWGNVAATRFQGEDGPLSLDGEVATAMVGVDASRDRWLAGVVLAHSEGEGGYAHRTASGGSIASTLTSLHPFARYRFSDRTSAWGTIGYGVGDLSLTPEGAPAGIGTDLDMAMAAFGGRSVLSVRTGQSGSFELAVRSDAALTRTESGASQSLLSATGATSRLRVVVEGTGSLPLGTGGALTPTLEAGLRYDGGDAETGAGLEIGGGLGYSAGRLTAELTGRILVAHEDAAYEEWGFSGSLRYQPDADGRGLKLSLGSEWGATHSAVQSMWAQDVTRGFAGGHAGAAGQRFDAEIGYGLLSGRRPDSLWTPFLAVQSAEGSHGAARFGLRLDAGPDLEASLEIGARRGANGLNERAIAAQGRYRW